MMTVQAQNALLKTIEEPPEYVVILLLTENADQLLPTINSRCVMLKLRNIKDKLIKRVSDGEAGSAGLQGRCLYAHLPREIWEGPSCWPTPSISTRSGRKPSSF